MRAPRNSKKTQIVGHKVLFFNFIFNVLH
jgi:hypothetical protein